MKDIQNNLSEFEREFELDDVREMEMDSDAWEMGYDNEYEFEDGRDAEYEGEQEWEAGQDEYEPEYQPESYEGGGRDREFEDRLIETLTDRENEFEMEMEIDRVLHEMEQDYFFPQIRKLAKQHAPGFIKSLAGGVPAALASKVFSEKGRRFLRGALKNRWLQKAAQFIPGGGPIISQAMDIAGRMAEAEMPQSAPRKEARQLVKVAKTAYQNLARNMVGMPAGSTAAQLVDTGKKVLQQAIKEHSAYKGKRRQIIPRPADSIVVVRPDKIILYS